MYDLQHNPSDQWLNISIVGLDTLVGGPIAAQ